MEEQELLSGREIGRRAAERVARAIPRQPQFSRSLMVVTRVVDGWHYDVDGGTKEAPSTISGVTATSAAVNAKVGDVLVVDVYNSKALAIGIMPAGRTPAAESRRGSAEPQAAPCGGCPCEHRPGDCDRSCDDTFK